MKRFIAALFAIVLFTPSIAAGHSGGTDENGCHTNHDTGEYHCHSHGSFKVAQAEKQEDEEVEKEEGEEAEKEEVEKAEEEEESTLGFRGYTWGTPKSKIIEEQGEPDDRFDQKGDEDAIVYNDRVASVDVQCGLWFRSDKLSMVKCIVIDNHRNNGKYVEDFRTLNEALCRKYGEPNEDHIRLRDGNEYTSAGLELVSGDLRYMDVWRFEEHNLRVTHTLMFDDGTLTHSVMYVSVEEADKVKKQLEQESQEKL